jgi:hypothetical protein
VSFAFVSGFCIWRKSEPMFGAYTRSASASAIAHGEQSRGRRPRSLNLLFVVAVEPERS